jgi:hypothetical protein
VAEGSEVVGPDLDAGRLGHALRLAARTALAVSDPRLGHRRRAGLGNDAERLARHGPLRVRGRSRSPHSSSTTRIPGESQSTTSSASFIAGSIRTGSACHVMDVSGRVAFRALAAPAGSARAGLRGHARLALEAHECEGWLHAGDTRARAHGCDARETGGDRTARGAARGSARICEWPASRGSLAARQGAAA